MLKTAEGNRLPDNPHKSGCISDHEAGVSCSLAGKYGMPFNYEKYEMLFNYKKYGTPFNCEKYGMPFNYEKYGVSFNYETMGRRLTLKVWGDV